MQQGTQEPIVSTQHDRWGIIPRAEAAPQIDGCLEEAVWQRAEPLSRFRTLYSNEAVGADEDMEVRLVCDDSHLYIGMIGRSLGSGSETEQIDVLLSAPNEASCFFRIPITITAGPREMTTDYSHGLGVRRLETPAGVVSALRRSGAQWTLELAVPAAAVLGGKAAMAKAGEEWRVNVIRSFGIGAVRPLHSFVPVRQSTIIDLAKPLSGYRVRIDALPEGRLGCLYWQRLPALADDREPERWRPARAELAYVGFARKRLRLDVQELSGLDSTSLELVWRAPSGRRTVISEHQADTVTGDISFRHPEPLESGWYELQLTAADHAGCRRMLILSFDSQALIEAGERLYTHPQATPATRVSAVPTSEEVKRLMALIPPQPGFIFGGDPEYPELYAGDKLFRWSPDDPFALTSPRTGTRHPNERFPEDRSWDVRNGKGEPVRVPYYEDAGGKRYSLTGLLWYEQKIYVLRQTSLLAKEDPLGTARLLNAWADAYAGWVPTNDYPWGCYPLEGRAGPPFHHWGGIWSRWSTSELGELRHLADAYAEVKTTNALALLSEEKGFDVERKLLKQLIEPSYRMYDSYSNWDSNNDYHNWIGLIALSRATGHPRYVHQAIARIRSFVSGRFLFDGFFGEVCVSYHRQSIGGLQAAIDELKGWTDPPGYVSARSGRRADDLDLERDYPILRAFRRVPGCIVYPNGHHFPIQDTWAFSKAGAAERSEGSLFLPAAGIARLTLGAGERQMQLYMSYVPKYGHDHLDPLNIALFACGQELLPDIGYTHTQYRQWTRSTLGHNTVVVDGSDMDRKSGADGGSLRMFAAGCADVQVMRASQEQAYPGLSEYSREAWLIGFGDGQEGYVVDLFRVQGGSRHEYTLNGDANRDSVMETNVPLHPYGPNLLLPGTTATLPESETDYGETDGQYHAYMYVRDVYSAKVGGQGYEATLRTAEAGRLRWIGLGDAGDSELFVGNAPSLRMTRLSSKAKDNNIEAARYSLPKFVARREGNELRSRFLHVLEPYEADCGPRIRQAEMLQPDQMEEGDIALAIAYGSTVDIVLSSGAATRSRPLIVGDIYLSGSIGFIRMEQGEVTQMVLIGGTALRKGAAAICGDGTTEGEIERVLRKANGDDVDAFVTRTTVSDEAVGSSIIVFHPDGRSHGYLISEVRRESGRTLLCLAGTDPGFTIQDSGDSEMTFYPFHRWSGLHRFRIDNMVRFR